MLTLPLAVLLSHLTLTLAQGFSRPGPLFDCSDPVFQVIYVACTAGDYTKCCTGASACCAGGCCDIDSTCINKGTANEGCCPVGDPTICGLYPTDSTATTAPSPLPGNDVLCQDQYGYNAWYCPYGSTCDSKNDGCILPSGSEVVGSSISATASPASSVSSVSEIPSDSMSMSMSSGPAVVTQTVQPSQSMDSGTSTVVVTASMSSTMETSISMPETVTVTPSSASTSDTTSGSPATITLTPSSTGGAFSVLQSNRDGAALIVLGGVLLLTMAFMLLT